MWKLTTSSSIAEEISNKAEVSYKSLLSKKDVGFFQSELMDQSIEQTHAMQSFFKGKERLVVIGVGGSSLGAKAMFEALYPVAWKSKIHFLDNVDGQSLDAFLNTIQDPQKWGWILCSKSGGTIEVTTIYDYCYQWFITKHNTSIIESSFVVTEEKDSLLFNLAQEYKIPMATMPKSIGGRFSIFSPIGLIPLSFLGTDLKKMKNGFEQCLDNKEIVVQLASQMMASIARCDQTFYFFQYSDRLGQWSLWLQQLLSESLSKKITRENKKAPQIPTVVPCRGASDQHSVLQQIVEGREKKFCCFHRVRSSEKSELIIEKSLFSHSLVEGKNPGVLLGVEAEATEKAMNESHIPTMVLSTEKITEESMSYLMTAWMLSTGVLGEMMDINAFDQPGVESGKSIARRVLSQGN